jgi:hypothetical protein
MTENKENPRKDWRDSILVKSLAFAMVGALAFGSYKLVRHMEKEENIRIETKYGWLRNHPIEYQRSVITSNVNRELKWYNSSEWIRQETINAYVRHLQEPKH